MINGFNGLKTIICGAGELYAVYVLSPALSLPDSLYPFRCTAMRLPRIRTVLPLLYLTLSPTLARSIGLLLLLFQDSNFQFYLTTFLY